MRHHTSYKRMVHAAIVTLPSTNSSIQQPRTVWHALYQHVKFAALIRVAKHV